MTSGTKETFGRLLQWCISQGLGRKNSTNPDKPTWSRKALAEHLCVDEKQLRRWLRDENVIGDTNFELVTKKLLASEPDSAQLLVRFKTARHNTKKIKSNLSSWEGTSPFHLLLPLTFPVASAKNKFFFGSRVVPLIGRTVAQSKLSEFVNSDPKFSWTCLLGPGGIGKSRLALDFSLALKTEWDVGFVKFSPTIDLNKWRPKKDTLILVDYAARQVSALSDALFYIANNCAKFEFKVRVLLLERSIEHSWWSSLLQFGRRKLILEEYQFLPRIELQALTDVECIKLTKSLCKSKELEPETVSELTNLFVEREKYRSTLFVMMIAEAIELNEDITKYRNQDIIYDWIQRELALFAKNDTTKEELNLVALATILGGIDLDALTHNYDPSFFDASMLPAPEEYRVEPFLSLTGEAAKNLVSPLEPDLIGELFVLEHLKPRHKLDVRAAKIRDLAWFNGFHAYYEFLQRASSSFPEHPTINSFLSRNVMINCQRWNSAEAMIKTISELCGRDKLPEAKAVLSIMESDLTKSDALGHANIQASTSIARHIIVETSIQQNCLEGAMYIASGFPKIQPSEYSKFFITPVSILKYFKSCCSPACLMIGFNKSNQKETGSLTESNNEQACYEFSIGVRVDTMSSIFEEAYESRNVGLMIRSIHKIRSIIEQHSDISQLVVYDYHTTIRFLVFALGGRNETFKEDEVNRLIDIFNRGKVLSSVKSKLDYSDEYLNHFFEISDEYDSKAVDQIQHIFSIAAKFWPHVYCQPAQWAFKRGDLETAKSFAPLTEINPNCEGCKNIDAMIADHY